MKNLIDKAAEKHILTREEIATILKNNSDNSYLFKTADEVRHAFVGDCVHLRGLIEFSNVCKQNCKYCGLRKDNTEIERYGMNEDGIFEIAKEAVKIGYKTLVLQSGESEAYSTEKMTSIIKKLKTLDIAITLSIGEKTAEEYLAMKQAGADRFLLRIETTDYKLYEQMHPEMSLTNRKACLRYIKKCGYETGTGNLVGLPNQTDEILAEDILFFKELDADMVGLGPFIPNPSTPMKDEPVGSFIKALKVMSVTRLLMPDINIPATTAMEALRPDGRLIALRAGANVVMPNVTDEKTKEKYLLYPGKIGLVGSAEKIRNDAIEKIKSIGRTISDTKGFRCKREY